MPDVTTGEKCYWRFIGDKEWKCSWPYQEEKGLIRMGYYIGDLDHGPLVDPREIEVR